MSAYKALSTDFFADILIFLMNSSKTSKTLISLKPHLIGRVEYVDLPDLDLWNVEAKIDSGAYSSSLHCNHVIHFEQDGLSWLRFQLCNPSQPEVEERVFERPLLREKPVKNSSGQVEDRYFIQTQMIIGECVFPIELSLTDRSKMKFTMLLGRKALHHRFLVDVSKKYLLSHYPMIDQV